MSLVCSLLLVYMVVLIGRAILSWFPSEPGGAMAMIAGVLAQLTDPVLIPLRRVIPPVGMFDVSFMVLFFGIVIVRNVLGCGGF